MKEQIRKKRRIYLLYMAIISVIKTNINHKNKIKYNVPEKLNISRQSLPLFYSFPVLENKCLN